MVAQSPPYAAQNAQHDAKLFRLATFSAWREQSGVVGPTDFTVSAQSTPNMSVQVGAGRAWIKGTQVASVSGGSWSTQGAYYCYNDAPVTLTVAAADPTNPRIDAVVAYVTDAFYNGSTNTFVLGIVTGVPAASPAVPAVPSNGLLLGTLAVAANATSIAAGNVSAVAGLMLTARGGIQPVTSTDVTTGTYDGQFRYSPVYGLQRWDAANSAWRQCSELVIANMSARPTASSTLVGLRIRAADDLTRAYTCVLLSGSTYVWIQDGLTAATLGITVAANSYVRATQGSAVVSTNGTGGFTVPLPVTFSTASVIASLTPGDNAGGMVFCVPVGFQNTATTLSGIGYQAGGAVVVSQTVRVNFAAWGSNT